MCVRVCLYTYRDEGIFSGIEVSTGLLDCDTSGEIEFEIRGRRKTTRAQDKLIELLICHIDTLEQYIDMRRVERSPPHKTLQWIPLLMWQLVSQETQRLLSA